MGLEYSVLYSTFSAAGRLGERLNNFPVAFQYEREVLC